MDAEELRLDGNAAAGLLGELFPFEMTTAVSTCAGCGRAQAVGALVLYRGGMGAVLRCPGCDTALIRVASIRGEYLLDLTGATCLRIPGDA